MGNTFSLCMIDSSGIYVIAFDDFIFRQFMVIALYVLADLGVLLIPVERGLIDIIVIVLPTGAKPCLTCNGS